MKSYLPILLFILLGPNLFGQSRLDYYMWPYGDSNKIEFSETVYLSKTNSDSIYQIAKAFVSNKFKSDKDSTSFMDYKKTVYCKGNIFLPIETLGERGNGYIRFTLTISSYYKAYRYSLTNIEHVAQNPDGVSGGALENDRAACGGVTLPLRYWNEEKAKAYYYIQTTIESLKEYMNKHSTPQ